MPPVIPNRAVGTSVLLDPFPVMLHHVDEDDDEEDVFSSEEQRGDHEPSDSSSIGVDEDSSFSSSTDSSSKVEEDEVQSRLKEAPLDSLESLDDSLPVKRGLSNFFSGKSKSFQSLSEAAETTDLVKKENPFNRKRRILMACKSSWRRRASCSSLLNASLPVLHSLQEDQIEEEEEGKEDEEEEEVKQKRSLPPLPLTDKRRTKTFRSPRCFSLSDLQQHANYN